MFDLNELYQQVILDHNKNPRNFGPLPDADRDAEGHNPLCGDHYHVYVKLDGDRVAEVRFSGEGCAISKAAASVMTEAVKGRTTEEIQEFFDSYQALVMGRAGADVSMEKLGKVAVFSGVSEFPMRVKCAILPWHTLKAALENTEEPVTTE